MDSNRLVDNGYIYAKEVFAGLGIDTDLAMEKADAVAISMHCWQGDDVVGFEGADGLSGGIMTTGNYPGRAKTPEQLRGDISKAFSLIPGKKKLSLHASYAEFGSNTERLDRDRYSIDLFKNWIEFAKKEGVGIDFNPTFYSHSKYTDALTLSHPDEEVRKFWIEHGKRSREIANAIGNELGQTCVNNFWMPDGFKDTPADTRGPRERMQQSLDEVFSTKYPKENTVDAIESKLFGIGLESHTVASHEFSYGYSITRGIAYTLDSGHFHPTELISGKFSSCLQFTDSILLHVSRGVRWDSDHVIVFDDELKAIMNEIVSNNYEDRVYVALDYFDASINRIAAWVIGMRNARKALLYAYLQPNKARLAEQAGNYTERLAYLEEAKNLPFNEVWNYYCMTRNVPVMDSWIEEVRKYEETVLAKR